MRVIGRISLVAGALALVISGLASVPAGAATTGAAASGTTASRAAATGAPAAWTPPSRAPASKAVNEAAIPPAPFAGPPSTIGTEFWGVFAANIEGGSSDIVSLSDATSHTVQATVAVPGIAFSQNVTVVPGTTSSVTLPGSPNAGMNDGIDNTGVHVTASGPVSVYGLEDLDFTTDGWTGLPVTGTGTSYRILGWDPGAGPSEFEVVGGKAGTVVTVVLSHSTGSRTAGTPYNVTLGAGQTYQIEGTGAGSGAVDLTGTTIRSTSPVSVFGGANCANTPSESFAACNMVTEQLPPTTEWGRDFLAEPLATRTKGDTWRVLANQAGTTVSINGTMVATLAAGAFFQTQITKPSVIHTSAPALVAQYSDGTTFDSAPNADPSMTLDPPFAEFLNSYTFATAPDERFVNFINIEAPTAEVGHVLLDHAAVPSSDFHVIPGSAFSGAQVSVTRGSHTVAGPQSFGLTEYGFSPADAYSNPGGYGAGLVAEATSLTLTPANQTQSPGTKACLTATVLDQHHKPLGGIPVSFAVTGTNHTSGFASTGSNGEGVFCYTGVLGTDTVTANAAGLVARAKVTFAKFGNGMMLLGGDGGMFAYGSHPFVGAADFLGFPGPLTTPKGEVITSLFSGIAPTSDRRGYWDVTGNGQLFNLGDAPNLGGLTGVHLAAPITGIAAMPNNEGYWMVGSDGGVFAFGKAGFHGSLGKVHLAKPIVGIVATSTGDGYWLVGADGGIFTFGDAVFHGSLGAVHLAAPIVDMIATHDGGGYLLAAADGGAFAFGDAPFFGSEAGIHLAKPVVAIALTADGNGYWLVGGDGGIFTHGDAPFELTSRNFVGPLTVLAPVLRSPIVGAVN